METIRRNPDDSGNCLFAAHHNFVPVYDEGQSVGICCTYCGYILYEHKSNTIVQADGTMTTEIEWPAPKEFRPRKDKRF
jgi:hypothetical protein